MRRSGGGPLREYVDYKDEVNNTLTKLADARAVRGVPISGEAYAQLIELKRGYDFLYGRDPLTIVEGYLHHEFGGAKVRQFEVQDGSDNIYFEVSDDRDYNVAFTWEMLYETEHLGRVLTEREIGNKMKGTRPKERLWVFHDYERVLRLDEKPGR